MVPKLSAKQGPIGCESPGGVAGGTVFKKGEDIVSNKDRSQTELLSVASQVLIQNYRQPDFVMARGKGCELWDMAGKRYLDLTAGISVCCLGHAHPALTSVIQEQAQTLVHVSNLVFIEQQILAAQALVDISFGDRVFFCNSGAEANEAALKLARRYQHVVKGETNRDSFVTTTGSFHGRTFATLAVTGQPKYHEGFGPLGLSVSAVPFDDLDAAAKALEGRTVCAMIVEPIQAEGGIIVPSPEYLVGLRKVADETGTLLIFDEVQTGIGRTGCWFGYEHADVTPDVMTLAKALAGGVPIGAVVATNQAAEGLAYREGGAVPHASTFGGNPLASAAARCVIETIQAKGLLDCAKDVGAYLDSKLSELVGRFPQHCLGTRGLGLLRGVAMRGSAAPAVVGCRERGVLLSMAGGNVVRFAPALVVTKTQIDEGVSVLADVLAELTAK